MNVYGGYRKKVSTLCTSFAEPVEYVVVSTTWASKWLCRSANGNQKYYMSQMRP